MGLLELWSQFEPQLWPFNAWFIFGSWVFGARKWQPTQIFLPRKFYGQRSLVGYSPWGRKELETTWSKVARIYRCPINIIISFFWTSVLSVIQWGSWYIPWAFRCPTDFPLSHFTFVTYLYHIMAPDMESQLTGKDLDAGKDWRQKEKGVAEDEMVRWHHQLSGHECKQTLGQEFKWRTGKLGMLQSTGSQRVRLNWATKQEKQPTYTYILLSWYPYPHRWLVRGGEQRKRQPEKEGEMRHREKRGSRPGCLFWPRLSALYWRF